MIFGWFLISRPDPEVYNETDPDPQHCILTMKIITNIFFSILAQLIEIAK